MTTKQFPLAVMVLCLLMVAYSLVETGCARQVRVGRGAGPNRVRIGNCRIQWRQADRSRRRGASSATGCASE